MFRYLHHHIWYIKKIYKILWIFFIVFLLTLGYILFAEITTLIFPTNSNIPHWTSTGYSIVSITSEWGIEPYIYSFATGAGAEDNDKFIISGNAIYTNFFADYYTPIDSWDIIHNNTYSIRIQTTDNAKLSSWDILSYWYALSATNPAWFYNHGFYPNQWAFAFLREDGSIVTIGNPSYGWSGAPVETWFVKIVSSSYAFAALKDDGSIFARWNMYIPPTETWFIDIIWWPWTFVGLKDDGSIQARWSYTNVPLGTGFIHLFSNGWAFAALKDDGSIQVWGYSTWWGSGAPIDTWYVSIYGTQQWFAALKDDGSLTKRWNVSGTPPTGTWYTWVVSTLYAFAVVNPNGTLSARWYGAYNGDGIPTWTGFVKIYTNFSAFAALKDDGSIKVWWIYWGSGWPTWTWYISIASAQQAFAALKDDGSIFARWSTALWGSGAPTDTWYIQISSTDRAFAALKDDGSIKVWWDSNRWWANAPTGTGFIKLYWWFSAFVALKDDDTLISRWNPTGWGNKSASIHDISFQNFIFTVTLDSDHDNIQDKEDNCPLVYNPWQEDSNLFSGPTISFTKTDYADRTLSGNQDCINNDICLTRQNSQQIYNSKYQTWWVPWDCAFTPTNTQRAIGSCENKDTLIFDNLYITNGCYPPSMINTPMCLHTTWDNRYYDITFTSRTNGAMGGWFSYTRKEYKDSIWDACDCFDTLCTIGNNVEGNLICDPRDNACPIVSSNGWWWWGGGTAPDKDACPNWDFSPSYYDNNCWSGENVLPTENTIHGSAASTGISNILYNKRVTRKEVAIVMTLFATERLWILSWTRTSCRYTDIRKLSTGDQLTIQKWCQLWLIGLHQDGVTPLQKFRPNQYITRNEFITVLSRLLYDGKYNIPLTEHKERYTLHIQALQKALLLTEIPKKITVWFLIDLIQLIENNPSLVQRS